MRKNLPGAKARIEAPRISMEQERPNVNRDNGCMAARENRSGIWERTLGVGLSHSSEETCEGQYQVRAGGAKGRAEQGTFRRER
jgi:hypothetical protein